MRYELTPVPTVHSLRTNNGFPLEEDCFLLYEREKFWLPALHPTHHLLAYDNGVQRAILAFQLEDIVKENTPLSVSSVDSKALGEHKVNLVLISPVDQKEVVSAGFVRITEAFADNQDPLRGGFYAIVSGIMDTEDGPIDFREFFGYPTSFQMATFLRDLCQYRYGLDMCWMRSPCTEDSSFTQQGIPVPSSWERNVPEVSVYASHTEVKELSGGFIKELSCGLLLSLDQEIPVWYNKKIFSLQPEWSCLPGVPPVGMPIVGLYSHPFDDEKLVVARLLEQGTEAVSRNRIFVTELADRRNEGAVPEERLIGDLYFRVLEDKILADGFYIGASSFGQVRSAEEGQRYRGKGLGSRILETAEKLFFERYKKQTIQFESETYYFKEGVQHDRGRFFLNHFYHLKKASDGYYGCLFEKKM